MKQFCDECARLEAEIEMMRSQHYNEINRLKEELADARKYASAVQRENEALSLDLAFYNKDFPMPAPCLPIKSDV